MIEDQTVNVNYFSCLNKLLLLRRSCWLRSLWSRCSATYKTCAAAKRSVGGRKKISCNLLAAPLFKSRTLSVHIGEAPQRVQLAREEAEDLRAAGLGVWQSAPMSRRRPPWDVTTERPPPAAEMTQPARGAHFTPSGWTLWKSCQSSRAVSIVDGWRGTNTH